MSSIRNTVPSKRIAVGEASAGPYRFKNSIIVGYFGELDDRRIGSQPLSDISSRISNSLSPSQASRRRLGMQIIGQFEDDH
jgi:hypothetical protein